MPARVPQSRSSKRGSKPLPPPPSPLEPEPPKRGSKRSSKRMIAESEVSEDVCDTSESEESSEEEFVADGCSQPGPPPTSVRARATQLSLNQSNLKRGASGGGEGRERSRSNSGSGISGRVLSQSLLVHVSGESRPSGHTSATTVCESSQASQEYSEPLSVLEDEGGFSTCDKNDKDWMQFTEWVRRSPEDAHVHLASVLVTSGVNCSAHLGKLIYRSMSEKDGGAETELFEKWCLTIIRSVLHLTIHNDSTSSGVVVDLVNMMFTELRHFTTDVLYSTVGSCLEYMKQERDCALPPRWIEIFGKTVAVIIGRGDIKHESDIIDGKCYKQHIVNEICRLKWSTENTASLVIVLREIPGIEDTEMKLIFRQIRSCMTSIKASAFPPIVHQLILLAGKCAQELLSICSDYFKNVNFCDTTSLEVRQKRNALGTTVYHFLEAARHGDTVIKAIIKVLKASFFDFGEAMSPFMLSVALGLTAFDHAKAVIIDPLRNSIMKSFHSLHLSTINHWYRQTVGEPKDTVTECFEAVMGAKSSDLEFMFDGIRELGIGLLNADMYQSKYPNTLDRCRILGKYLISSIVKSCSDQLPSIMKHLLKVSSRSSIHTECLANCLEVRTRQIIQPLVIGRTCEIIRHLPMMESESAALLVKALSNAFHLSYTLLDQLMLNLRKTIWKSVDARKTAAKIMIILLSNSRVVGDIPFSQYSESQRGNDSQAQSSFGQLPDNQPLCIEILTLTKRCFSQQCEIRKELYLGFHSVVRKNPGLCELICSQLFNHGNQYLTEESGGPTLRLTNVVDLSGNNTPIGPNIIKEEIGFLVQCLCFVVWKSHKAFSTIDDGPPSAVDQLESLIKKWVTAILDVTQGDIEAVASQVVGDAGGARPLETVRYIESVFILQIMQAIEALIEFLNIENGDGNDRPTKKLFDKFKGLEPLLKRGKEKSGANKKGKGDKTKPGGHDKSKDSSRDDASSVLDTASEASENHAAVKLKKLEGPKRIVYMHIVNLDSVENMLQKLYRPGQDRGALNLVHENVEFENFLLSTVKQKLASFKRKEPLQERNRHPDKIASNFADVAGAIWMGILVNPSTEGQAAELTMLRLEVISEITAFLCCGHSSARLDLIKSISDECSSNVSYDEVFPKFFNSWKSAVSSIDLVTAESSQRIHEYLFTILQSFGVPLSPDTRQRSQSSEILNWLWGYMSAVNTSGFNADTELAEAVTSCWFTYYMKGKCVLEQPGTSQHDVITMAKIVHAALGSIEEFQPATGQSAGLCETKLWIINEETAPTIFCVIMNNIETLLNHISALLAKLKSHQTGNDSIQRKASEIRENCFNMINQILGVSSELVISAFPSGVCVSTMLKVVPQIFSVMIGFGEYFLELSKNKQEYSLKGFAVPVSRIGKDFKILVEGMIQQIERVQSKYAAEIMLKATSKKTKTGMAKVPNAVKAQLLQEKKLIPNMIYSIEKYDQQIIALSSKLKDKKGIRLLIGMKLSTARDFRIDEKKLTEALNNRTRRVNELPTVPDDETNAAADETNVPVPGSSRRPPTAAKTRKARKRKKDEAENDG